MQAVLLAAGRSSRMFPFAQHAHKALIRVMGKPIVAYTIEALQRNGIRDIVLVVDNKEAFEKAIGNGESYGVQIQYVTQNEARGAGNALLLAKEFIGNDFFVLNASHMEADLFIKEMLTKKKEKNSDAVLLAKEKKTVYGQGVLTVSGDKVTDLVEKPDQMYAPSQLCVVGIYLFSRAFLRELAKTKPEHYQLEMAIAQFAKTHDVHFLKTEQETITLKYAWDLLGIKDYLLRSVKKKIAPSATIAEHATVKGDVFIGENVTIMENAVIKGSCFIGNGSVIGNNAILRNGVIIEENVVIGAHMEVKNSLVMQGATTHSGFIGDSVIGEQSKIAAQFCSANVRLDRKPIVCAIKENSIDTQRKSLGCMIGQGTHIGIQSATMPGVMIGEKVTIGPATKVTQNIENSTTYYTKFQEVKIKK